MDYFHHEPRAALITPAQIQSATLARLRLSHAIGGLYLWEYLTTFDYEWKVIRGHLPYRWTIWIYSVARLAGLVSLILSLVTMDVTTPINCQLWMLFSTIFSCLASVAATLLIVLRTFAIWNGNKAVVTLTIIVWGTSIGFHLYNITLVHFAWYSTQLASGCGPDKREPSALGNIATIIVDNILLLIILSGVFVIRYRGGCAYGLTRLLWKQGVIWLVLAFAFEVPQLVFTSLHSNDPFFSLFGLPSQIILIIASTRMHRSLVDFASGSCSVTHGTPQVSNLIFSKTKRTNTASSALDRVEIAIHPAIERHPTISTMDDDSSTIISTSEQTPEIIGHSSKYSPDTKDNYAA